ncbi:major facilitator superfamily domain-containing protein 12-like [Palaemon carinicauda]|uniref:major facilitator superfamily domain-containing protein 12-like n=1 Tax=Palaemon carinicauda TaxID=392227 RepID=UPI0035B62205
MDSNEKKKDKLPLIPKLCYGVGHFMNDLCASMWFSYILLFYVSVLKLNDMFAGYIMLVGQIADGLSTPIVGILADKQNKIPICARYGRRKSIHLIGTILVIISFPFIFNECLGCADSSMGVNFAFHAVFVIIFQFAWACVQVSHLALIPSLANRKTQRTELNSIRYAFMVLANMLVFVITFIFLGVEAFEDKGDTNSTTTVTPTTTPLPTFLVADEYKKTGSIGPEQLDSFRNVALTCIGIGTIFSIIFHVGTKEPQYCPAKDTTEDEKSTNVQKAIRMRKRDWFKMRTFYQVGAMYTATRLYVNLYMTYIPLFVDDTLNMEIIFIAVVPMIMHFSSFLGSFAMKPINRIIGRKRTFSLGCCVGLAACIWIGVSGQSSYFGEWAIYFVAVLLGIGGSILLITSLSITADLIGENSEGGAFVYGFMSLLDKVSNGIVIMVIQKLDNDQPMYYREVLAYACGVPCIFGILVTLSMYGSRVGTRDRGLTVVEIVVEVVAEDKDDIVKHRSESKDNPAFESDGHI